MTHPRKRLRSWCAAGLAVLLIANVVVAVGHLGSRAGRTYRWVNPQSGAELFYNPSEFGSARLTPGKGASGARWQLVEPPRHSPALPWNWLALLLDPPAPDPESVIRQENLIAR